MKRHLLLLVPLVLLFFSCKENTAPTAPKPPVNSPEPPALKARAASVEQALAANNAQTLKTLISPKYVGVYASAIDGAGSKLADFSELFKTRTLVALDSAYAVYQITYNGSTYEVSFAMDIDSTWKLTNF